MITYIHIRRIKV